MNAEVSGRKIMPEPPYYDGARIVDLSIRKVQIKPSEMLPILLCISEFLEKYL